MQALTLQTFLSNHWMTCATLSIERPEAGIGSPAALDYDVDYFIEHAAEDALASAVRDSRAVSVNCPVDLASFAGDRWHSFVLDLIPQGVMRRRLAAEQKWRIDDPRLDYRLLIQGAGSPIGNLRILEARLEEERKRVTAPIAGVTADSMLRLDDAFIELWERAGLTAGGSEGVQGDWPKILMTRCKDGLWRPDSIVADEDAVAHALIKRAHPKAEHNSTVLRSEAGYLELARQFGLRAGQPILAGADAIQIARFDRTVRDGRVLRYGQESLASAADIPEFGASVPHTRYVEAIRRHTTDPTAEIVEYVLRDVLNLAAGNIDNHGRNTALQKFPDGRIALSPVFDFAPMRLVQEGPRVTRWTDIASDVEPDWTKVAEVVCADLMDPSVLLAELKERAPFVRELPARARALGIDEIVIERAMNRHDEIADTLDAIAEPRPKP